MALAALSAVGAAPVRYVQINSARGKVEKFVPKQKGWQPAKVGDKLFGGSQLRTAARSTSVLRLDGADSTTIYVGPNTLMQIAQLTTEHDGARRSKFSVRRGMVRSGVRSLTKSNSSLQISTPACMGGVRGTVLAATVSQEGLTAFGVPEGAIAVLAAGAEVALPEGTMNRTKPGEPPGDPEPLPESLEIALQNPAADLTTNQPKLVLQGRTAPGAIVTLNGDDVEVHDDGTFSIPVELTEGENVFTFEGTDVASNVAQVVRKVILDTVAPPLRLD